MVGVYLRQVRQCGGVGGREGGRQDAGGQVRRDEAGGGGIARGVVGGGGSRGREEQRVRGG